MAKNNTTRLFNYSGLRSLGMKSTILALLLVFVGCGGNIQKENQTSAVVLFGDSIFGRLTATDSFKQSGFVDGGVFGWRTDQLRAVFPDVLSGKKICHGFITPDGSPSTEFPFECSELSGPPSTVIIFAGWNNLFQGNKGDALADLQSMAAMAAARRVKVIICTLYAFDPAHPADWMLPKGSQPVTFYDMWRDPLNDGIRAIPHIGIVDLAALFSSQSDYTLDGVHPTDAGNVQLMDALSLSIQK